VRAWISEPGRIRRQNAPPKLGVPMRGEFWDWNEGLGLVWLSSSQRSVATEFWHQTPASQQLALPMNLFSKISRITRLVSPKYLTRPIVNTRPYSMEPTLQSPPFTQLVVKAMRSL